MNKQLAFCVLALASRVTLAADPQPVCDPGPDNQLELSELEQCFILKDPKLAEMAKDPVPPSEKAKLEARDLAEDALDGASAISIDQANAYLRQRVENTREPTAIEFGWPSLRVGRTLTDTADPRQQKYPAAFILSYVDDRDAGDDSFVALGDINWFSTYSATALFSLTSSIDVTTQKDPTESSIDFALPVSKLWTYSDNPWLSELAIALEPKYATDRDFRRDVLQVPATFIPSFERLLRAGYTTPLDGDLSVGALDDYLFYWQPLLALEYGTVNDSGGSAPLEAIRLQGSYTRAAAGVGMKLSWPLDIPISINASYTYRWDYDEHWSRGFLTTGVQYDVAKNFAITLTYRNGRKPDTFEKTEDILLGIGVMKTE
jgi:hypothetical protein